MSLLSVSDRGDGVFVVDSRLIAAELDIQHKNFLATLDKYLPEVEEDWGRVAFETLTIETPGGKQDTRIAYLTKEQADLLMTYSKNTEPVRRCKRNLVKAFSKAKQVISAQAEELERLRLENENLRLKDKVIAGQERVLARSELLALTAPQLATAILCPEVTIIEKVEVRETTVLVDYQGQPVAQYDGMSITQLAKRYGFGKGTKANDACRAWLLSLGIKQSEWLLEPMAHLTPKLPREKLKVLDREFLAKGGDRQKLIGEWG